MNIQPAYHTLGAYAGERREIEALHDRVSAGVAEIKEELSAAYDRITQLEAALEACLDYFESRSDVIDGDYGVPAPNAEMKMLQEIEGVLP